MEFGWGGGGGVVVEEVAEAHMTSTPLAHISIQELIDKVVMIARAYVVGNAYGMHLYMFLIF